MNRQYNTDHIRNVAKGLRFNAGEVGASADEISRARFVMEGTLKGKTADKLRQELGELHRDMLTLSDGLSGMQRELFAIARRLDDADRAASAEIKRK